MNLRKGPTRSRRVSLNPFLNFNSCVPIAPFPSRLVVAKGDAQEEIVHSVKSSENDESPLGYDKISFGQS